MGGFLFLSVLFNNMKLYSSLDEALRDTAFENDVARVCIFDFVDDFFMCGHIFTKQIEPHIGWLKVCLERLNQPQDIVYDSCSLFGELTMNAYRWVERAGDFCITFVYIGEKGIVVGTKQNNHFLSPGQIALLENGERVLTARAGSASGGTDLITDVADGLLILEKEKSIYVAKYFL